MTRREEIRSGITTALPTLLSALPFGILFGTIATDRGLSLGETMLMSLTMYAGASQLVGIELFQHNVAAWLVILSIFAVNFRHVLYSAALTKHMGSFTGLQKAFSFFFLVDPQFAEALKRAEGGTKLTFTWYMAFATTFYIPWQIVTLIGALFGSLVGDPRAWGLDVLLSIYFMGLVLGFRNKPNWLPTIAISSLVSVLAYLWIGPPWNISIGALAGIALAAMLPVKSAVAVEIRP